MIIFNRLPTPTIFTSLHSQGKKGDGGNRKDKMETTTGGDWMQSLKIDIFKIQGDKAMGQ